jgi:hypothetical protein
VRVVVGVKRPLPLTHEDATARFNRYKRCGGLWFGVWCSGLCV